MKLEREKWATRMVRRLCCIELPEPCNAHRFFKCPRCRRWAPWTKGCADNMPEACDDCWARLSQKARTA